MGMSRVVPSGSDASAQLWSEPLRGENRKRGWPRGVSVSLTSIACRHSGESPVPSRRDLPLRRVEDDVGARPEASPADLLLLGEEVDHLDAAAARELVVA